MDCRTCVRIRLDGEDSVLKRTLDLRIFAVEHAANRSLDFLLAVLLDEWTADSR